jgi:hypothetical protein
MPEPELAELATDIKANGLREPLTLTKDGLLLDGRNRDLACERVGVVPTTVVYQGDDPVGFSLSMNKHRRHLDKTDLAFIGEKLAALKKGLPNIVRKDNLSDRTTVEVAKELNIGRGLIDGARSLKLNAAPNVIDFVTSKKVGISTAAAFARHTPRWEQAKADVKTIKALGTKFTRGHAPKKEKPAKLQKQARINPPRRGFTSIEDREGLDPEQRVHLWSKKLKDVIDAKGLVEDLVTGVVIMASDHKPEPERFFELIDQMKAWKPVVGATDGSQSDYARNARASLETLKAHIETAYRRVSALRQALLGSAAA